MEVKTFQEGFSAVVNDLGELMFRKQHDYGPGNILAFGEFGILVRLNDKIERLKHLFEKDADPANESLEDTWRDIANYAIIALMLRRGWFTLPLGDTLAPGTTVEGLLADARRPIEAPEKHTRHNCGRYDVSCPIDGPEHCDECKHWIPKMAPFAPLPRVGDKVKVCGWHHTAANEEGTVSFVRRDGSICVDCGKTTGMVDCRPDELRRIP